MTKGRGKPPAAPMQPADLSPAQIQAAIPQLESRIKEVADFQVDSITGWRDPAVIAIEHAINTTVGRIFGANSLEYDRLKDLFRRSPVGPLFAVGSRTIGVPSAKEIQQSVEHRRQQAISLLSQQVKLLKEQLGDGSTASGAERAIRAYSNLDLHPEIAPAVSSLYRDGHYANAIEDAVKALNAYVRYRSGETLDGTSLMQKVFSPNARILRFNDMQDQSDKDEQQGFMMLFAGAVAGLRNPRAHKLIKDDPERALEFIAFVSLLAKILDEAKK
jgi:uncharacterized protein (TIGR02391 family)